MPLSTFRLDFNTTCKIPKCSTLLNVCAEQEETEITNKLPLWEADWDDEDIGEDFAVKLKEELAKAKSNGSGGASDASAQPMQISK